MRLFRLTFATIFQRRAWAICACSAARRTLKIWMSEITFWASRQSSGTTDYYSGGRSFSGFQNGQSREVFNNLGEISHLSIFL